MRVSVLLCAVVAIASLALVAGQASSRAAAPIMHQGVVTGVLDCPVGQGVTADKQCSPCLAGYFKNVAGLIGCNPCPEGSWSATGSSECVWCPDGHASPAGSPGCNECDQGTYAKAADTLYAAKSTASYPCYSNGWFDKSSCSLLKGEATCAPCSVGRYQPAAVQAYCLECANGFTSQAGAVQCTSDNTVRSFMELEGAPKKGIKTGKGKASSGAKKNNPAKPRPSRSVKPVILRKAGLRHTRAAMANGKPIPGAKAGKKF